MKKCNTCRHLQNGRCFSSDVWQRTDEYRQQSIHKPPATLFKAQELNVAREICDREGDGRFVYFEPKTPASGTTFRQIGMAMVAGSTG